VVCRFGYMLMADPAAALAETHRVLRPGGRLSCAVIGAPEENPWSSIPGRVLVEAGHLPPARLQRLLVDAGLDEPQIEEVAATWTFSGEDDFWDFLERMAGAISMVLGRLDADEHAKVRADARGAARGRQRGDPRLLELSFGEVAFDGSVRRGACCSGAGWVRFNSRTGLRPAPHELDGPRSRAEARAD
jgi:SAM-dependent methyltransferase